MALDLPPSKIMERMLLHQPSKGYGYLWAAVSEKTFRRPLSQICKAIVKPFQQRRPWAPLLTLLGKQGFCWMNENPHLWHSAHPVMNLTCARWTNNTIKCTRWFIIVMADTVGLNGSRARTILNYTIGPFIEWKLSPSFTHNIGSLPVTDNPTFIFLFF